MPNDVFYNAAQIPPYMETMWKKLLDAYQQEFAGRAAQGYRTTPFQRLANIPPEMLQAQQMASQTGAYQPTLTRAEQMARRATETFPETYQQYMNPYQQAVLDKIRQEGLKTFKEGIMPELENKFIRLGQHGSARHRQLSERGAASIQDEIMARQQRALAEHYNQAARIQSEDQNRRLQAAREIGSVALGEQAGRQADIQGLQGTGEQKQDYEQRMRDIQNQEWGNQRDFPLRNLQQMHQAVSGIDVYPSNTQVNWTPPAAQMNRTGSFGGAMLQLLGANMMRPQMNQQRKRGGHIKPRRR